MTIVLAGATAVGKSSLALILAERLSGTILMADSMQVYQGMDIGTAKPTPEDQRRIPHGGIDCVKPDQSFSVADYLKIAQAHIDKYSQHPLIVCGGTGLYLKALREGLAPIPATPSELKAELQATPLPVLQRQLRSLDPQAAATIDINNPARIIRALAVIITTGQSILTWQAQGRSNPLLTSETRYYWLQRSADEEKDRIASRVHQMLERGWIEEVQDLLRHYPARILMSHPAIGYGLIAQWLISGNFDALPTAADLPRELIDSIISATRQYRRRQYTWFRKELCWKPLHASCIRESDLADELLNDAFTSF
jgi:tRNA dimethylallyltransferase